ncbi:MULTISPECIES: YggT family protein [Clostridia]|uniref:YggT family protein n=1 Tax=Clostridia TaxID=186801 RepID=UPI000EA3BCC6|nr:MULTISPECIES: YggT family protein [Clostridia]NBJ68480.1 YggT family protein [Roseburia sp. 1XD42-34]RKI81239.1 YggT family protein [Clostridium sp. 1xD42-85]
MQEIFQILNLAFTVYTFALIIYIFMSWFPGARESAFGEVLTKICEPYLEVFRKFIPPLGMIDFSPIVAIIVLRFAQSGLLELFRMLM